jgi:hypothetical protein
MDLEVSPGQQVRLLKDEINAASSFISDLLFTNNEEKQISREDMNVLFAKLESCCNFVTSLESMLQKDALVIQVQLVQSVMLHNSFRL